MKSSRLVLIENTANTQERGKIADGYADVAEAFSHFFSSSVLILMVGREGNHHWAIIHSQPLRNTEALGREYISTF